MIFMELNVNVNEIEFNLLKKDNEKETIVLKDKLVIPKSFEIGNKLNYIRKLINNIIREYNVNKSCINVENVVEEDVVYLIKIEGILEEVLFNSGVQLCR